MITVRAIDHINFQVKNLKKTIEFYQTVFGFKVKETGKTDDGPWAIFGSPEAGYFCAYEYPELEMPDEGLRISHFGLYVDDFESLVGKLRDLGVDILYGGAVDWGKSNSIYITDPSGWEIELAEQFGGGLD
jgi:catechol 2,3-dioxygenase-like lactoylglutathione lyase family enzyme